MKRFWIVLLSVGLMMAFTASVFAADVKFSGEFYLQGWYDENHSVLDKDSPVGPGNRGSTAFYTERLRMQTGINVAKGLRLWTRFTALNRKWMAARKAVSTGIPGNISTESEAENIAFDIAFVYFETKIGAFTVGTLPLGQEQAPNSVFAWIVPIGPWQWRLGYKKSQDGAFNASYAGIVPVTGIGQGTDNDTDSYSTSLQYQWSTGLFSVAIADVRARTQNVDVPLAPVLSYKNDIPFIAFAFKNQFGKIYAEDELFIFHGSRYLQFNYPYAQTQLPDMAATWAVTNTFNINVDLAPVKLGFQFVYTRGDDPNTRDKKEGGFLTLIDANRYYDPCLILWNEDYMYWMGGGPAGKIVGNAGSNGMSTFIENAWVYQLYGNYQATPKMNLFASLTYAYADVKPTQNGQPVGIINPYATALGPGVEFISKKYGTELDLIMRYKIYDNLEYMIGAGYLWTGDYFKGTDPNTKLSNNYLITHKLTLTF